MAAPFRFRFAPAISARAFGLDGGQPRPPGKVGNGRGTVTREVPPRELMKGFVAFETCRSRRPLVEER